MISLGTYWLQHLVIQLLPTHIDIDLDPESEVKAKSFIFQAERKNFAQDLHLLIVLGFHKILALRLDETKL